MKTGSRWTTQKYLLDREATPCLVAEPEASHEWCVTEYRGSSIGAVEDQSQSEHACYTHHAAHRVHG